MKICAIIAEYNPFHNGHLKQIKYAKENLECDKLLVIMSGNFTQRGENAVLDKFTRAKHAVLAGADVVIELPTVFATANAEIFATGAVKILNDLNCVTKLCFGVESGTTDEYLSLAKVMLNESKALRQLIKEELDTGISPVKARYNALKRANIDGVNDQLISSPNNILALEYAKAVLKLNSKIELYSMIREGDHNSTELLDDITSASSIRTQLNKKKIGKLKKVTPPFVYKDLPEKPFDFSKIYMSAIHRATREDLAEILDCTEGLENRIKALAKDTTDFNELVDKVSTKRYTYARVRRIITANLLGITEKTVFKALDSDLYCKVLAVSENSKDVITHLCANSSIPVLTRKKDYAEIKKFASEVIKIDELSNDLFNLVSGVKQNEYQMILV